MKKRLLAMLMIAALALGMLAGCGKKEQTNATPTEDMVYTVTLAHDFEGKAAEVLNTYIAKLSETFPFIAVETMKTTDITDENQPNVVICLPERVAELVAQDALLDMEAFKDDPSFMLRSDGEMAPLNISEEQHEDMYDVFYDENIIDGKLYALPLARATQVMYYNNTFFDENGLDLPMTWEELELVCQEIKAINPNSIPVCIDDEAGFLVTLFSHYQGGYTTADGKCSFNSETNRELAKMLNDWYQKGYITTKTLMNREGVSSTNAKEPQHYIVLGSSAEADSYKPVQTNDSYSFELGIFSYPHQSYETRHVLARGPSMAMYKCDDDDLVSCAWMLVLYLATDIEFQARFAEATSMQPVMQSVYIEDQYSSFLDKADGADNVIALAALSCMEQETSQFAAPAFDGAATVYAQMGTLLNKCLTITGDDMAAQIEAAFQEAENACK